MSLKTKRIDSGYTQHEAAKIFGLKYRTYQNYENGVTSPDMDTAAMMARYFDCTIGDLFDLEEGKGTILDCDEMVLVGIFRSLSATNQSILVEIAKTLEAHQ